MKGVGRWRRAAESFCFAVARSRLNFALRADSGAHDFFNGEVAVQDVLLRIVVHIAEGTDVVIELRDGEFVRREDGCGFLACPGKVVAVVFERDVGVLRRVETAALPGR